MYYKLIIINIKIYLNKNCNNFKLWISNLIVNYYGYERYMLKMISLFSRFFFYVLKNVFFLWMFI